MLSHPRSISEQLANRKRGVDHGRAAQPHPGLNPHQDRDQGRGR